MKTNIKYIISAFAATSILAACTPEEFGGADIAGFPSVEEITPVIEVDQELNQVTFSLPKGTKGLMPMWIFTENKGTDKETVVYSSVDGYKKIYTKAGDYEVDFKVMNRNGHSDGTKSYTFHIDNTLIDFGKYTTILSKNVWYFDNTAKGHLACGPSVADPISWWAGDPDCKAAEGLYDNSLTFTEEMEYTFKPGAAGTMYVNKGTTLWGTGASEDFRVEVGEQITSYSFDVDGDDLYLTFPANTQFPYIAFDECYTQPRYKVINMTPKTMTLVAANADIAWQYILTTTHEVAFNGFDVNSPDNLWKQANPTFKSLYYAHTGDWVGLPDYEHSEENGVFTIKLPTATENQWQAQYAIQTELNSSNVPASATYDFSCIITPNKDLKAVTLKLTSQDDNTSLFDQRVDLVGFEDNVVYFTEMEGKEIDGDYKFVFDFGGNPENTEITIKDIVLIDHSKNTITPPSVDPEPEGPAIEWGTENLLNDMAVTLQYYYAPGWAQIADPETTIDGTSYTVTLPAATTDQWQAQMGFHSTGIALDPNKHYDFRVKIVSNTDHSGVTVKLTQEDNDGIFLTEGRHALNAFEETWIELGDLQLNQEGEITNLKIMYDFGGNAENTIITISGMQLQEHKGPRVVNWDLTGEKNLWLKGKHETISYYYAPGWAQIADPVGTIDGNSYAIVLPEATSDQWQAQWHISTELGIDDIKAGQKYDIRITLSSNTDHPGVTFKFTEDGNDENFLTADRHALTAYEDKTIELTNLELPKGDLTHTAFKLALDFGGNAAGAEIVIKDIIIQVAE